MAGMEGYRYSRAQDVAFRDLDGLGVVNNAVYLTYIETARLGYMVEVLGIRSLDEIGVIVAKVDIDFRSPATLLETLAVGARVARIGTKSLDMDHEVRGADGRLVAQAATVLVSFDYAERLPVAVPDEWRTRIESYEAETVARA
jgi:acyl-CoA thioester hydrolase